MPKSSALGRSAQMASLQGRKALLGFFCLLGLALIICSLLFYVLIVEGGLLINTNTKKIGFLSFCLWNETEGKFTCNPHFDDLKRHGIAYPTGVAFGSVLSYLSLPIYVFVPLTQMFAWLDRSESTWKLSLVLSAIAYLCLSIGTGVFLLFAGVLIELSQLGYGFMALTAADALLLLQGVASLRMLAWFLEKRVPSGQSLDTSANLEAP